MIRTLAVGLALSFIASSASACNIPVFRYALERWQSDNYEVAIIHEAPLTADEQTIVRQLEEIAKSQHSTSNLSVVRLPVSAVDDPQLAELWEGISLPEPNHPPIAVVRLKTTRGRTILAWKGKLRELSASMLLNSPARQELATRFLKGHSVVWLLIKGNDDRKNGRAVELMKSTLPNLERTIKLPEGIGLTGSELFSEVPLLVRFSLLEIDAHDSQEAILVQQLTGLQPEAFAEGEPLVVPIFGRGRALEVIPAADVTPDLLEDLSLFLSGACSCQVKDRNPGFDLLMSCNWNEQLFGAGAALPPPPKTIEDSAAPPVLLTIPPGRKK